MSNEEWEQLMSECDDNQDGNVVLLPLIVDLDGEFLEADFKGGVPESDVPQLHGEKQR